MIQERKTLFFLLLYSLLLHFDNFKNLIGGFSASIVDVLIKSALIHKYIRLIRAGMEDQVLDVTQMQEDSLIPRPTGSFSCTKEELENQNQLPNSK